MNDVMATLKDRRAKAEAKVVRAAKALELAKNELADLLAAERVMAGITGESIDQHVVNASGSDRDVEIARLLETDRLRATSPAELYPVYVEEARDNINLEAFRTALWRLQKRSVRADGVEWAVKSQNGRYWREAVTDPNGDMNELLG